MRDRVPALRLWLVLLTLAGATAWGAAALALWQTTVPGDLNLPQFDPAQYLSGAEIERATDYQRFLGINALLAALAQLVALGIFAARGARFARESAAGRIGTGMLLGMLALAFVWIAQFPFALAATWWQRRYDISDLGYLDWAIGYWMQAGGKFLFISLALLLVMALAGRWPRGWWLGAAPALVVIMGMLAFTTPYLMFELKPLRDEGVAADAQRLAEAQGVSDTPVFVEDTLGLTSAPNAGAAGLGPSERVIVWDNLLERFERSETEIVLAHELAHLSRGHIAKKIAWLALLAIPIAFIAQRTTRSRGGLGDPAAVPLAVFVVTAMLLVALPLQNAFSQRLESEADWVALEQTRDPDATTSVFQGFVDRGLAAPDRSWWQELAIGTHPSIMRRIAMAEAWRERNPP